MPEVEVHAGRLDPGTVAEVRAVVTDVTETDGVAPLSEQVVLHLRHGGDPDTCHLLVRADDGALAGYAHLDLTDRADGPSAELAVAPRYRGRGLGRQLGRALLAEAGRADGPHRFQLWAHGAQSVSHGLARSLGLQRVRELRQLRRSLLSAIPGPQLPDGVTLRTFRPGVDDDAWLALNARAFADHPEQGDWTGEDLRRRQAAGWFDPDGFFVAERAGPAATSSTGTASGTATGSPRLVGFHWTKIHRSGASGSAVHGDETIGEVYVLGVDPAEQGGGLGRALTLVGLRHLRHRGLSQAMLFVEADNAAALRLYSSVGFVLWDTDTVYGTPHGAAARQATERPANSA